MDFRIGTGGISYTNVSQAKQDKKVERQSFQGSLEKVIQNQKMTQPQDSIEFSEESDFKKLEKIKELNDATDFSGMTDIEKYTVIIQRYEKAFPDLIAQWAGAAGNSNVAEHFTEEINRQNIRDDNLYQIYKGYDKMTDEQKWESIQKEYGSPKNGIEQISLLKELKSSGLVDSHSINYMIREVIYQAQVAGTAEHGRNYKVYDTEVGSQYAYEYLQNNRIDVNAVAKELKMSITFSDFQKQQEFNYEIDYIVDLMNALDEREEK